MAYLIMNKGTSDGTIRLKDGTFKVVSPGEKLHLDALPISHTSNVRVIPVVGGKEGKAVKEAKADKGGEDHNG
jgi:hypothetical protein